MYNSKNISFFGTGGIFSNIVLNYLIDNKIDISFVVILIKKDSKLIPMNEVLCKKHKIEYIKIYETNTKELSNILIEKKIDLGVIASYSQILKPLILNSTKDGFINIHPSFLPCYRGANPIFWQIKDLKDEFGVTVHCVNEKIDDGKILNQAIISLKNVYTANKILEEIALKGAKLLNEIIKEYMKNGYLNQLDFKNITNLNHEGFYNKKPCDTDFEVDLFNTDPILLKKLALRLKKWGYAYFIYDTKKIYIDKIENIDLLKYRYEILDINKNKWKIMREKDGCTLIKKQN